jgi:hypothetical protein
MFPTDALCALVGLFILSMAGLRARMQYSGTVAGRRLTLAGAGFFGFLILLMIVGWYASPLLARGIAGVGALTTLVRGLWFLAVYYLSIPLHRALRSRGIAVFV